MQTAKPQKEPPVRHGHGPWARAAMQFIRFRQDESGVLVGFSIFMALLILMVGGLGVDFMRFEMNRARLQNTVDRAVLAAASLEQDLDPTAVVNDYFTKSGLSDYLVDVSVNRGSDHRTVTASASMEMKTSLIHMLGIDTLTAPAIGRATESVSNVEISMVLDISGSMQSNDRMPRLRDAARTFVDTVLRPESRDKISISLVPYSGHVNPGPLLFDKLNVNQKHGFSHCIEFLDSEFNTTTLDTSRIYEQVQHFTLGVIAPSSAGTLCPKADHERITPFSQDAAALHHQIDQLEPQLTTSIMLGMKWGAALLDPSMRGIASQLASDGDIDTAFANRPAAYDDPDADEDISGASTLKTIILMTDGENTSSDRLADWAYENPSHVAHWAQNGLAYFLYVSNQVMSQYRSSFTYTKYRAEDMNEMLASTCDAAKAAGIVIWTIGFEITDTSAEIMEGCATSPAHFFRVDGVEIEDAFHSIANQINRLKLTL